MPIDPNQPTQGGVSEQQPQVNQQVNDAVSTMAEMAKTNKSLLTALDDLLKKTPTYAQHAIREFENMSLELKTSLEYMTEMKETMQAVQTFARKAKAGLFDTKDLQHASNIVEEIKAGQEKIMKLASKGTREYKNAEHHLQQCVHWQQEHSKALEEGGKALEMNEKEMQKFSKFIEESAGHANELNRNLRNINLGHMTRQVQSISKAFAEVGIGKGFAAKIDKFAAGAEVKAKIRDMRNARVAGNVAQAQERKAEAQDWVKKNAERLKLKPEDLDFDRPGGVARQKVAERMGLGKAAQQAFMQGDEAEAFKHGAGGALKTLGSMAATGAESGIGEIAGMAGEFAGPLAAVAAAVELLREGIDKTAKQNKDIESSMGKAGLFAGGGGMAFTNVRNQLTPHDAFTMLGMSFDRNLKIAQAMQEAGRGLSSVVRGEGLPTAGPEFGPGGFGQVQRIAMGAGRMAGFTDAEGVERTMKLVSEYGQTLEASEDFFIKVRKSADAAGLSTTKYISIIDDVLAGFDRMNKGLDQTMNILGELSKTGRLGAAELKEYMDFLMQGGQAKVADIPWNVYTRMREGPEQQKRHRDVVETNLKSMASKAGLDYSQFTGDDALDKLQRLDLSLTEGTGPYAGFDETQKTAQREALRRMTQAVSAYQRVFHGSGGLIGQAFGETVDQLPAEKAQLQIERVQQAVQDAGGTWEDFMKRGMGAVRNPALLVSRLHAAGIEDIGTAQALPRAAATNLLAGIRGMTGVGVTKDQRTEYRKQALIFLALAKQKKIPIVGADGKPLAPEIVDGILAGDPSSDKNDQALQGIFKNTDALQDVVNHSDKILGYVGDMAAMGEDVTAGEKQDTLDQARFAAVQTQTTGEVIANAFSKWFNNLVGGMGKIVDWIEKPSKGEVSRAEQVYGDPKNIALAAKKQSQLEGQRAMAQQEVVEAAKKHDRDALDVAEAKVADTERQMQALQDRSKKGEAVDKFLDLIQPQTKAGAKIIDMSQAVAPFGGSGLTVKDLADMANIVPKKELAGEIFGTLAGMKGVTGDVDRGTLTVNKASIPQMMDQLYPAIQKGLVKMGSTGPQGTTFIVNNYQLNSADFSGTSGVSGQMNPPSNAGQAPPSPPPTISPDLQKLLAKPGG